MSDKKVHPIPDTVYDEALRRAIKEAEILNPLYVERIVAAFAFILEAHMKPQKHLLKVLKEVGGMPVEWESDDCFKWEHKQ